VSTAVPYTAGQDYSRLSTSAASSLQHPPPSPAPRRSHLITAIAHPLTAICAVQAVLSLTLVWSNTAFADEAQYLTIGKLDWAHWLHGAQIPSISLATFSGSPVIYPPIGALADSVGGIAGARILSLVFMLAATALLYFTALRLFGRGPAVAATALWALSEPVIRLAFATFDPMSVLLTALSAWLVVRGAYSTRWGSFIFATLAAFSLALANATAYSGVVIDPVVLAFALFTWLPHMRARRAALCVAWLTACLAISFGLLMTASGSWAGLTSSIFNHSGSDHQSVLLVLYDSWGYSGLIAVLALVGVVSALSAENRLRAALIVILGCTALVVPVAQFYEQTAWSLDKHLAYGIWFASMAAGYGCKQLIERLPGVRGRLAAFFCIIILIYPAASAWNSAWKVYHAWPNARSFVGAIAPVVARSGGPIYVLGTGPQNVAEYYLPQGADLRRWVTPFSLDPVTTPRSNWASYYAKHLGDSRLSVICLFYATTFSSAPDLPGSVLLRPDGSNTGQQLLGLVADNSGEPGLTALTLAVEEDSSYRLTAVGPYDSSGANGVYAIWQRKAGS